MAAGSSGFEAFLPHGFYTIADVIEDVTPLNTMAGRQKSADNPGDMAADIECLGIVDADALHTKTETANAWEYDRLSL